MSAPPALCGLDPADVDYASAGLDPLQVLLNADALHLGDGLREFAIIERRLQGDNDPLHLKARIAALERRIVALEGEPATLRQQQRPAAAQVPAKRRTRGIEL